jgi:hypothetical protein
MVFLQTDSLAGADGLAVSMHENDRLLRINMLMCPYRLAPPQSA